MINYQQVNFETSVASQQQLFPSDLPEIVFSGRSNVGKSSLINKLCNRKALAHTGGTPGKTRTINFYKHPQLRLVDLPGYGYAKCSMEERAEWGVLIEQYFDGRRDIRLVCALVDARHAVTQDDLLMLDFLAQMGFAFTVVATKSEKLKNSEKTAFLESLPEQLRTQVLFTSARSGEGIEALKNAVEKALCARQ